MLPERSYWVIPSRRVAKAALNAASVMSLARCISASSAADLNIRQPAVTGVALTSSAEAASRPKAVHDEEAHLLLQAEPAGGDATIAQQAPAIRANGLSSSCQMRTSCPNRISSRARASSNAGQTHPGSPRAGSTSAKVRSERRPPYAGEVAHAGAGLQQDGPDALLGHEALRLGDRARRSSSSIGRAPAVIGWRLPDRVGESRRDRARQRAGRPVGAGCRAGQAGEAAVNRRRLMLMAPGR